MVTGISYYNRIRNPYDRPSEGIATGGARERSDMIASMQIAYGDAFSGKAGSIDDFANQAVRGATDKITNPYQAKLAALSGHQDEVDPTELKALKHAGIIECTTCAGRKYQDGSDEENVSFKTPGHVDPSQSVAAVTAHEHQHVQNAMAKTAGNDATLLRASVTIHYATCPECGRRYASGGVTNTAIRYNKNQQEAKEQATQDAIKATSPYQKAEAAAANFMLSGALLDGRG